MQRCVCVCACVCVCVCAQCPDEINHEVGDITYALQALWGEEFALGGLAGIPFVGQTGFNAFSHHVQSNGNVFVLFAPHVGVHVSGSGSGGTQQATATATATVDTDCCGAYLRAGQSEKSPACGAAIGAYNAVKDVKKPGMYAHCIVSHRIASHRIALLIAWCIGCGLLQLVLLYNLRGE